MLFEFDSNGHDKPSAIVQRDYIQQQQQTMMMMMMMKTTKTKTQRHSVFAESKSEQRKKVIRCMHAVKYRWHHGFCVSISFHCNPFDDTDVDDGSDCGFRRCSYVNIVPNDTRFRILVLSIVWAFAFGRKHHFNYQEVAFNSNPPVFFFSLSDVIILCFQCFPTQDIKPFKSIEMHSAGRNIFVCMFNWYRCGTFHWHNFNPIMFIF